MTKCIYYDLEIITPSDVQRARDAAGRDAVHVRPTDVDWPDGTPVTAEIIWPQRNFRFREILMGQFNSLQRRTGPLIYRGVDLLEIIRYEWVFAVEEVFHRTWVISELAERYHPDLVRWVTSRPQFLPAVRAACRHNQVRFSTDNSVLGEVQNWASRHVSDLKEKFWRWRERLRTDQRIRTVTDFRAKMENTPVARPVDTVLFAEFYTNSSKLSLRVAEATERSLGRPVGFIAGRMSVCDTVMAKGWPCFLLDEFSSPRDQASRTAIRPLAAALETSLRSEAEDRSGSNGAAKASHFNGLIEPVLRSMAAIGSRLLQDAASYVDKLQGMIQELRPSAVVSTTYNSIFGRALSLSAERAGVPSIFVQHGVIGELPFFGYFPYSKLLLWGDSNIRALASAGVAPERLRAMGAVIYDDLVNSRENKAADGMPEKQSASARVALLGSRPGGSVVNLALFERILRVSVSAVLEIPGARLMVKLHPGDRSGIAHRLFGDAERVTIIKEGSSQDVVRKCDAAIVTSSTTGLEACVLDKPLIEFNPTGMEPIVDYQRYHAAILVEQDAELPAAVKTALTDEAARERMSAGRRRLIADVLHGATGRATQDAVGEILATFKN